jgi:hypothetical protein
MRKIRLDPHISPAAALFQIPRIAKVGNMPGDRVRAPLDQQTRGRLLGLPGEPRVNVLALVLALNLALVGATARSMPWSRSTRVGQNCPAPRQVTIGVRTHQCTDPL